MKKNRVFKGPTTEKSFMFSIEVIKISKELNKKKEFILSRQLLRSGTAIGALAREAQYAESTKDFIHKLAIAQKETDETLYWLDLLYETDQISKENYQHLFPKAEELMRLISSSILTSKKKI